MKISVIVPHLRGDRYLADCLESIAAAGTKAEGKVSYRLFVEQDEVGKPAGVAAMRNLGLRAAEGDYVLFTDSDDYISDDAFLRLCLAAEKNPGRIIALRPENTLFGLRSTYNHNEQSGDASASCQLPDGFPDSVTGLMIPLETAKSIEFVEKYRFYSDLPYTVRLIYKLGLPVYCEGVYYRRYHNDQVRLPALSQLNVPNRYAELFAADSISVGLMEDENRTLLDDYICKIVFSVYFKGKKPEGTGLSEAEHESLSMVLGNTKNGAIERNAEDSNIGILRRRDAVNILLLLRNRQIKRALKKYKRCLTLAKKEGRFGSVRQWKLQVFYPLFGKLPVKKKLYVFESFNGKAYGDSCRSIYEEMKREKRPGKYVWILDGSAAKVPGRHREVKPLSLRYFYFLARCGLWVNNMRQPEWFVKRPGMTFVETWHGTPLKKLVFDMEDVHAATPDYKNIFYKQSRAWDILLSDNRFSTEIFKSAFLFDGAKILETGYPRNDLLFAPDREQKAAELKKKLGIPEGRKVVLYAPTWRDDEFYGPNEYKFELPFSKELMKSLSKEYYFLLRTHYFIADRLGLSKQDESFVKDCTSFDDITELYLVADVLITDYSSVFFDYACLKRPILFYTYDYEKYRDVLRGFYFDMEKGCPGPLLKTEEELKSALKDIGKIREQYAERYEVFTKTYCSLDDGHAAERVIRKIFGNQ